MTLCVASQQVFIVVSVYISLPTQSGNVWIHPRMSTGIIIILHILIFMF
jgi:hypothetical protein